jgi:hypothetical protein
MYKYQFYYYVNEIIDDEIKFLEKIKSTPKVYEQDNIIDEKIKQLEEMKGQ